MPISTSSTEQRTQQVDSSQTAADQAVNLALRRGSSIGGQTDIRLGKNASLTVVQQGPSLEQLMSIFGLSAAPGSETNGAGVVDALNDNLAGKFNTNAELSRSEAFLGSTGTIRNYIFLAVGGLLLLALFARKGTR